jgi:hypothetical protein
LVGPARADPAARMASGTERRDISVEAGGIDFPQDAAGGESQSKGECVMDVHGDHGDLEGPLYILEESTRT